MARKILVVDDEKSIVHIISYNLKKEGFEVVTAYDGQQALRLALTENPELILLDIMMPKLDGFEVCRRIREKSQVPIIMLTARAEEVDKVMGLDLGADDYVTKPFGVRELMARVKANLRKKHSEESEPKEEDKKMFTASDLVFDLNMQDVKRSNGDVIALTPREFELTKFLATQSNQVFTREQLLEKVWGYEYFGDVRTVDVTIRRLRSKLEETPETPKYIMTKRGIGYYFNDINNHEKH
jgi:two-component system response regulator VicR